MIRVALTQIQFYPKKRSLARVVPGRPLLDEPRITLLRVLPTGNGWRGAY